ncbi:MULTISPECIES: helix-turn-helix domain-containing protein [unclassified Sphingomonas]|uniref:helix-turn-helix domain-containing protein n=1 Tax=unclassified Sphingomonas TaxID=196159 RepID=UPI002269DAE7|nr:MULTISPECIES: helix-turn-helix domain-containing protein [unclassified Sphingomonas]
MVEHVRIRILPDGRVSRADAAAFLGRSAKTMADWFSKGVGPRTCKVGGRVFYYMKDLEAYRDTGAREAA